MSEGFSIIQIGNNLSKPVTVFIEKISNAIEGYFKPYQIKRVAKATSDAEIIKYQGHIEKDELTRRAIVRFINEEANKQNNMESITEKAIPFLADSSNPKDMDDDWIMNFFDKCRIVSDEDMQVLWARVLAGEANSPGTYSKRTIISLASLDKADAELFIALCGFTWLIDEDLIPLLYSDDLDLDQSIYKKNGIDFKAMLHLSSIGLISFESLGYMQTELKQQIEISYHKTNLRLEFKKPQDNKLFTGNALLTSIGKELAQVCSPKAIDGFFDYSIKKITEQGITCIK